MSRIYEAMQRAAAQNNQKSVTSRQSPASSSQQSAVSSQQGQSAGAVGSRQSAVSSNPLLRTAPASAPVPTPLGLPATIGKPAQEAGQARESVTAPALTPAGSHPWERPMPGVFRSAFSNSASNAHTDSTAGLALPGGVASRDAGATLDAAGPARETGNYPSVEISPSRVEPHLVAITQPRSAYTEQFRNLRTRVLSAGEKRKTQVVVVTSAGVGEGKTLTSLNLAWMLAQTEGVKALLIDSDLRRPCAAPYLGLHVPIGLSEVLSGQAQLEQAITRLEPAGLYLLPGGEPREDVAEMLAGPTFSKLLKKVRTMFDYIIVDAPPIGVFSDASTLINRADGALLVVRANKTKYKSVERLLDGVPRDRMLGVILNQAEEQTPDYGYYGYENQKPGLKDAAQEVATA